MPRGRAVDKSAPRYWNREQVENIPADHILSVRGTAGCKACVPEQTLMHGKEPGFINAA